MSDTFPGSSSRNRTEAAFPITQWPIVQEAGQGARSEAHKALEALSRAYWEPVYAFIRRSGKSPYDAEDLTQKFFLHLFANSRLGRADPKRGKFRSFLRKSIKNFLVDDWRKKPEPEREGKLVGFEMDTDEAEERYRFEPAEKLNPAKIFDCVWTRKLIDQTVARLKQEYISQGKIEFFEHLHSFLPGNQPICSRTEAAQRLGLKVDAFNTALHRMKKRYGELLREEIAKTLANPTKNEIEEELRFLLEAFSQ